MKKILFTFLLSTITLTAQEKLRIEYRYSRQDNPEKLKEFENEMKQKFGGGFKMGEPVDQFYELEYNDNTAIYHKIETLNNAQGMNNGMNMSIHIGGQFARLKNNLTDKNFLQEVNLDKENYLVKNDYTNYDWKITDEETEILGYKVIKAISESEKTVAWFAPELKVNVGPEKINGLPGTILKTEKQETNKLLTLVTFEAEKVVINPKKLQKEKEFKGKEISSEEFKVLQDESKAKLKESFSVGIDKS